MSDPPRGHPAHPEMQNQFSGPPPMAIDAAAIVANSERLERIADELRTNNEQARP